ncbi:aminotransferase [Marmoricola endophyticus]|uniref:Aminotransferase n=1 Tax=Marmoricola endophyticus TaxID=2040280 RepID=A0A917BGU6_9ACTN|nr:aminotransferase class I/II-fold pyridoxal phosphate-dependent enzyme [Marmoricola endophyticus]GGF44624.1 aminotransferase [Marmoricola endophyticus]
MARAHAARLTGFETTIFAERSKLAVATGSVNLGQGFPDEDGPSDVIERAAQAMHEGRNQYAPGRGTPELVAAVRAHQRAHYGIDLAPEQVVATTGATEAVAAAILGLVEPGDEVLTLEPYYDSYAAMVAMAGGVRRGVPLRGPSYRPDPAELAAAITPRTRLLLLNSPHNPTGTVLTRTELEQIAALALEHDLTVVTDEVYEHLTFTGAEHVPISTLPGMAERTLTISSIGKSFSLTGWKVGWATGPAALVAAVESAKNWLTYTSGAPLQPAAAYALDERVAWTGTLAAELEAKRDLLVGGLRSLGLDANDPQGTYFVMSDVADLGWPDAVAFADALVERAGVVVIPCPVFYGEEHRAGEGRHKVRWAFCKRRPVLEEALERLAGTDLSA